MPLTGSYLLSYYCLTEYQNKQAHYFHQESIHHRMNDFGLVYLWRCKYKHCKIWNRYVRVNFRYSHLYTIGFIIPIYASNFYILTQYKINREKEGGLHFFSFLKFTAVPNQNDKHKYNWLSTMHTHFQKKVQLKANHGKPDLSWGILKLVLSVSDVAPSFVACQLALS